MITKQNVHIKDVSWVKSYEMGGGKIGTLYIPDTVDELRKLCTEKYQRGEKFLLMGHASNTYFTPDYNCECVIQTRNLNRFEVEGNILTCECGVSVSALSRKMVDEGFEGFEGMVDMPGTIAAAIYGNAGCYGCDINSMLKNIEVLLTTGEIVTMTPPQLGISKRQTVFKTGEVKGIILSARLNLKKGVRQELIEKSKQAHEKRLATSPGMKNNLGSVFAGTGKRTLIYFCVMTVVKTYRKFLENRCRCTPEITRQKTMNLLLTLLLARDLIPYLYHFNCFVWKDEKAHQKFSKFIRRRNLLFAGDRLEIEIKGMIPK